MYQRIIQRRDITIFFQAEPLQQAFRACRDPCDTRLRNRLNQRRQGLLRVLVIHADPTFHRYGPILRRDHLRAASRHSSGRSIKTAPKLPD